MNRPPDELLQRAAPLAIWRKAERQALRSPHTRWRTGAVIYYGMGDRNQAQVYSQGCAHPHDGGRRVRSIHAEAHAVSRLPRLAGGAVVVIVTLTKCGHYATVSKPCQGCAELLRKCVWGVIYAERTNAGTWVVRNESPEDLLGGRTLHPTNYAKKHMA